ncbi:chemotaxis protein CheW [Desulfobulbus sp. US4]|nr:chemotaxis protein CheW [Desulfobulbus sp. US4]
MNEKAGEPCVTSDGMIMRELLLLDLAGFRCGVWKEDILSHEEQIIHWLTDNNGAATAIAMMGAHPVSLADLSYCIGLAPAVRAKKHPLLVPADHDLSVGFVVEQEAGMAQVPSSAVFSLPTYLQTAFIDSCVQLDGKLVPLINIRAIHCRLSAADYTPPTPQFCLPVLKEKRTPSLDSLRVFICKKKSFAASADYFSSEQAVPAGVLTGLPLMPEFVRGITLHSNRVLTVLDIRRYLQLPSGGEGDKGKWLIGEVEGQGFAFVVDADQGLLPADFAPLAALPLLVRSDWQQSVVLHARKIIPVLDFSELLVKPLDECSQAFPQDVQSDGRFEAVFGTQQVKIVEFSILKMSHALPDLEVLDIIPFSHCQRLVGTRGLIAGVTLYRKELLPVLDPARCFGRKSSPGPAWKLLLVCNGDLRVLVMVEDVLGKRSLNVSEQRALPFTAPHSSVYGCYPVAGRVGLIFNIMALSAYFDDEQIRDLFFFADDLLPPVNDVARSIELNIKPDIESNIDQGTQGVLSSESSEQENSLLRDDLLGRGYAEEAGLLSSGSDDEGGTEEPFSSLESCREAPADDWELEKNASVLLTEEQDTLVQSVVASMLSRKDEAIDSIEKDNQDNEAASGFLRFTEEPEDVVNRVGDIRENSDDIFPTVVAAMLSRKGDDLNELGDLYSEGEAVSQAAEGASDVPERAPESAGFLKENECRAEADTHEEDALSSYGNEIYENETSSSSEADTPLEASPVLLTDDRDHLITSTLASMLLREENEQPSAAQSDQDDDLFDSKEEREGSLFRFADLEELNDVGSGLDTESTEPAIDLVEKGNQDDEADTPLEASPALLTEKQDHLVTSTLASMLLREENEQPSAAQSDQDDDLFDSKEEKESSPSPFADLEEPNDVDAGLDTESTEPVMLTQEQRDLLQSTLVTAFHREEGQKNEQEGRVEGKKEQGHFDIFADSPDALERTAELEKARLSSRGDFVPDVPSEYTAPFKDLEGTDDDREQVDMPVAMFTEEQDALLRSSLSAAFSQQKDGAGRAEELVENDLSTPAKEREGNAVVDELAHGVGGDSPDSDLQEKDEGSIEGLQNAGAINAEFSSSAARDAGSNTERKADSIDGSGEQVEKTTRKEIVSDVEFAGGGVEKDLPHDVSAQLKDGEEALSVPGTWNVLEDEDAFPELKDFVRQVSGTQQADSPLAMPPADFVKQVRFPTLSSPDPRKIKKQLDKARQKQRDILFWKAEPEQEERPDIQPRDEKRNRTMLWILLLLLALSAGFFLWLFVFQNQEISREKSIKPETPLVEISRGAPPLIQDVVPEKGKEDEGAGKNNQESIPTQSVSHSPDVSESKLALEGQEALERESLVISVDPPPPPQTTSERTSTGSPVEELPEKIEHGPEILPENDRKPQSTTDHKGLGQEQGEEGRLVKSVYENEERAEALTSGHVSDNLADNSGDGAADAVAAKSAVAAKNGVVEDSIATSSDDAENKSKGESVRKSVTAVSRKTGRVAEEVGIGQARVDEKRVEQQLPASAVHSSQGISADIVGDGQETAVKSIAERGVVDSAGDRRKGTVKDGALGQRMREEGKQADGSIAEIDSGRTQIIPAASTEKDRSYVDQEKTTGVYLSKEKTTPADQKSSPLMSPVNGISDHTSHTVSKGDTLWEISEQYTGSGFNYPDVAKKNKIANPDMIYPNQQVILPTEN